MIYLENNNGTQQIFIPKNINISVNKTYDEGFQDGMEYQKGKLTDLNVTKNGVYKSDNGYKQVNVEVPLDSEPCNLIELNGDVDETGIYGRFGYDDNVDGYSSVYIDARSYGDSRYQEGYNEGVNAGGGSCNLGELEYNVDSDYNVINALPQGFDGFHTIKIDATEYANSKYNEGYNEGVNAGGGSGEINLEYIQNTYSVNALEMNNLDGRNPVIDRSKILDTNGEYNPNNYLSLYANFTANIFCPNNNTVSKIEEGGLDSNSIKYLKFNLPIHLGENALNKTDGELFKIFFKESVTLEDNSLSNNSKLSHIFFFGVAYIEDSKNPFRNISSTGKVYGLNVFYDRCFAHIMDLLGNGWEFIGYDDSYYLELDYYKVVD